MKTLKIQNIGHLIVLDINLNIVGITNILNLENNKISNFLNKNIDELLPFIFKSSLTKIKKIIESFKQDYTPRALHTVKINKQAYYLKISRSNDYIYIETEPQYKKNISTTDLNQISFLFENKFQRNWKYVCKGLNKLLNFDRVFVLQIQDTGYSEVLAEQKLPHILSFNKKKFSKSFIPQELIDFYRDSPYRYLANIDDSPQILYSNIENINIQCTQFAFPPELKLKYLSFYKVKTALFFPLYLRGKFWGIVVAHNQTAKNIDMQSRKLCTFIIQNAMSRYEGFVQQGLLDKNNKIQEIQNRLIKRLKFHKNMLCALVENMESLKIMLRSEGIAIYNEGDIYVNGITASSELIYEIVHFIEHNSIESIFIDHNFKQKRKNHFSEELPFSGILAYNIDKNHGQYILWFRKETLINENELVFSESFEYKLEAKTKVIHETAIPWNDEDLSILHALQSTLNHSLLSNLIENKKLINSLSKLNNELEMFTYTLSHDLKNPLSILKMGLLHLIKNIDNLDKQHNQQWYDTLLSGTKNIEDIINNTIHLSQNKINKIEKNKIQLKFFIRKIVDDLHLVYPNNATKITYGTLLPIWGEKTSVYQIFSNIISNSIKYSQEVENPTIHINSYELNDAVWYEIQDNGMGIPKEDLESIYDMFSRAKNTQNYQGSGIGLTLVRRIIKRLDGEIDIQSEVNKGTIVKIKFPIHY